MDWSVFWSQGKLYSWCSVFSRRIKWWQNLFLGKNIVVAQLSRNCHLLQTPNIYYRYHKIPPLVTYVELTESTSYLHRPFFEDLLSPPPAWGRDSFTITLKHMPYSVGLLWTTDQPYAEISTWQHTTLTRHRHPSPMRDSNPKSQQASGRRPAP